MSFYALAPHYEQPIGRSYGPLDYFESEVLGLTAMPATEEEKRAAGACSSADLCNRNTLMVLRSLGYDDDGDVWSFDAKELQGRVVLAQAISPISDDGQPNIFNASGGFDGGIRPGYFHKAYEAIADVCEFAIAWGVEVTLA